MHFKATIALLTALFAVATAGCQKKLTEQEKNAPPPLGPHGEQITPGGGAGGGGTGGGGTAGGPGTGGAPQRR